ncbi:hypothetical protein Hypma_012244 [Hypsizygus marmoreus]|uniref:F-box domain-containing protein n=1 Tax=Hypsizygus marmoreus TaxID=39966 RepID=A0A369JHE3_HYPMA|nr:hypothetical protein Hypma_012244 [Hypsizygus marmoreus]
MVAQSKEREQAALTAESSHRHVWIPRTAALCSEVVLRSPFLHDLLKNDRGSRKPTALQNSLNNPLMLGLSSCSEPATLKSEPEEKMGLNTLPYDLLLNIASRLELRDVHALHLTCKSLYDFSITRPVYRKLATDVLRRCRALPLKGFQRITDLSTEQLIRSVNKANRYERAWRRRGPYPISTGPYSGINPHSNYMDVSKDAPPNLAGAHKWYKVVSAPPKEEVDWLSPITSSYTLCATKSGKVVCWDVQTDTCLAEWNPGERWELWKCRVEFEEKTVFFTMAKIVNGSYDDGRIMEFVLMRLKFSDSPSGESSSTPPVFSHVTDFKTAGVVMNVFLLDPIARLLSAFVWVSSTNTIGLYALPDWDQLEYVFIDTGIECVHSSNWSCILHERNIVIHCEESDGAYQYFYPLHLLQPFAKRLASKNDIPTISYAVSPAKTLSRKFTFPLLTEPPRLPVAENSLAPLGAENGLIAETASASAAPAVTAPAAQLQPPPTNQAPNPNPFPSTTWSPDSAHFVRQWWPSLPGIPRVSCTVVLLSSHDLETHHNRFILAQHYFRVPLNHSEYIQSPEVSELPHRLIGAHHPLNKPDRAIDTSDINVNERRSSSGNGRATVEELEDAARGEDIKDDALMHLWYVSTPFEVVCVSDSPDEDDDGFMTERPRPLVAVDFGHAVWIEYADNEEDVASPRSADTDAKWLRFVTFPPFGEDMDRLDEEGKPWMRSGGEVRTLDIPDELDLDAVETINIDQSQGAIILSVRDGKIFILCYE